MWLYLWQLLIHLGLLLQKIVLELAFHQLNSPVNVLILVFVKNRQYFLNATPLGYLRFFIVDEILEDRDHIDKSSLGGKIIKILIILNCCLINRPEYTIYNLKMFLFFAFAELKFKVLVELASFVAKWLIFN